MKLKLIERPTVEIRNNIALVIFPAHAYWFSADPGIEKVLDVLVEETEELVAVERVAQQLNISCAEAFEILGDIKDLLYKRQVLSIDGKLLGTVSQSVSNAQQALMQNTLIIGVTQKCNLACPHCYADAKDALSEEMTTQEFKQLIDQLASMPWSEKVERVGLTGGEIFTRPDAMEIISYTHDKGFKVLVSSNAVLLTDEIIDQLAKYDGLNISISLDGPTAEIHEMIRGKGTFEPTIAAIRRLSSKGVFVGIYMFIHKDNVDFIGDTLSLADSLGVSAFNCLNMVYVGRANLSQAGGGLTRISDRILFGKLFVILRDNPHHQELMKNSVFVNQITGISAGIMSDSCGIGTNRSLYVRSDGNIYPCSNVVDPKFCLGNIRQNEMWDIWQNSDILKTMRAFSVDNLNPVCAKCAVRYFCGGGCRGETYFTTEDIKSPHYDCAEMKESILDMMLMLTEKPDFMREKVESLYQAMPG
jgi:radical SAM protein with 4Fe4S-binding SPASM domain